MLEEILNYIHNYFEKSVIRGKFTISSNTIELDLQEGQYYKIEGSIFNDGIHQYPSNDLHNEVFEGKIYGLAIPKELLAMVEVIEEWQNKYSTQLQSPYQSESFGGYSYTKASGGGSVQSGKQEPMSWKTVFGNKLNHWRKIA